MWKRLNRPTSPTAIRIGKPTLLETSLDEDSAAKLRDLYPATSKNGGPSLSQIPHRSQDMEDNGRHAVTYGETPREREHNLVTLVTSMNKYP